MSWVFVSPNQAYRVRSHFLASVKKRVIGPLTGVENSTRYYAADTFAEETKVTSFMEGIHTEVARMEGFRVHPSTFEGCGRHVER